MSTLKMVFMEKLKNETSLKWIIYLIRLYYEVHIYPITVNTNWTPKLCESISLNLLLAKCAKKLNFQSDSEKYEVFVGSDTIHATQWIAYASYNQR
jgi:hypothetical protein